MRALRDEGRYDEALALLRETVARHPEDAEAHHNLGMLLKQLGQPEEGERESRRAVELAPNDPGARYILATTLLAQGKYEEGWPLYEARLHIPSANIPVPKGFPFPRWRGEDVAGRRVAIFPEQGLGDQIQFARFLPVLRERGAELTLFTRPPLVRLFAASFPDLSVMSAEGAVDFPDPDFWAMSLDLAQMAGATPTTLPRPPYLRVPAAPQLDLGGMRVGLMTSGNPAFVQDARRSLPAAMAQRLRQAMRVPFLELDPAVTGARDFADTAALIERLDLVIAVDTGVAHLAGALGKPCFVMLQGFGTDWRWMTDRSDSPWYPSLRLYRQGLDGDWGPVIERVAADAALVVERGATIAQLLARDRMAEAAAARDAGRHGQALAHARAAVEADPDNVGALHNLSQQLLLFDALEEGEAAARKALARAPDMPLLRYGLAKNLMTQGRLREGWALYGARRDLPEFESWYPRDLAFPHWEGEPLAGKHIAIFPEQGLGDQIQFARFLPQLVAQGARVTLLAPPPLAPLFAESFPDMTVIAAAGSTDFPDPDYWATAYELPGLLDAELATLPPPPYLRTEREWRDLPAGLTIGLMTRGNPAHRNDAERSLAPEVAEELRRRLPGTVIDLDPASTGARDFADTAALLARLDLVVTVDTAVGHLAGALDKPCYLLVPGLSADWRWMRGRDDSPWYPNHRLYRGTIEGDWTAAIDRLVADVTQRAAELGFPAEAEEPAMHQAESQPPAEAAPSVPEKTRTAFKLDDPAFLQPLQEAVAAHPRDIAYSRGLGILLNRMGRAEEAGAILRETLAMAPTDAETRTALGVNLLGLGHFADGWPLYAERGGLGFARSGVPKGLTFPRWAGEPLQGKRILITPEQGMGDQMQFARFLPLLTQRGAEVTMLALPALIRLFEASFPNVTIMPAEGAVKLPPADYWATLVDLPIILCARPGTIPTAPYLTPSTRWRDPPAGLKVGLMTKGNPLYVNDRRRSLTPDLAAALAQRLPGTIIELQPEETGAKDFADTAALIAELDLVVSVDTGVAHLAGAMGKPVFLLLPGFNTDWRWMRARCPSPWYPEHRLYLSEIDDWSGAVDRLVADVKAFAERPDRLSSSPLPPPDTTPPISKGWQQAARLSRQAAERFPEDGKAQRNAGHILTNFGMLADGERFLRKAIERMDDPVPIYELAHNLLQQGRYPEGFALHQVRRLVKELTIGYPAANERRRWKGEPLAGRRIVILPEQGMGDQIQFARFLPMLIERGASVTLYARAPQLLDLFAHSFPQVTVRPAQESVDLRQFDYWTTLVELPHPLGITLDRVPAEPYLRTPRHWQGAPAGFKIGLQTKGNPNHVRDKARSLSDAWSAYLQARLPGTVILLDPARTGAEGFAETAAVIDQVDLVVSVDTSAAHLAGAMGKRCFTLISGAASDWRWLHGRDDSPWYPSMTLYRGDPDDYWKPALDRLIADAHALAHAG